MFIKVNPEDMIHCHNTFTPKYYMSQVIGPAGMILGQYKTDNFNIKLEFGQYCEVYEKTSDTMTPRSVVGISLRLKNYRGLYYFISLEKGRLIHVGQWTVPHVTESVIVRVEQLAADEGINKIVDVDILFYMEARIPNTVATRLRKVDNTIKSHHQ